MLNIWRKGWDSNPRYVMHVCRISSFARAACRTRFHRGADWCADRAKRLFCAADGKNLIPKWLYACTVLAFLGIASAQAPSPSSPTVEILDRSTDLSTVIAPQCLVGTVIEFRQAAGVVNRAEVGAYLVVRGGPNTWTQGVYRVHELSFRRDRDRAVIDTRIVATCISRIAP